MMCCVVYDGFCVLLCLMCFFLLILRSHQQKELTAYNNYMVQEQQKINTLPANEQNSHENQLKMENIRKTYAKMAKELIELTRK